MNEKEKMIEDSIIAKTLPLSATTHTTDQPRSIQNAYIYTYIHNFKNTEKINHA